MEHASLDAAFLSSDGVEDGLVVGEPVVGNSAWVRTPARFLVQVEDPRRTQHPALLALGLAEEDDEAFEEALAEVVGATLPGSDAAYKQGVRGYTASRLGGTESPIQGDHAHAKCGQCEQPLVFLGQFDDNTGFHFADAGAAYVFACLQHPRQVLVDCQTH